MRMSAVVLVSLEVVMARMVAVLAGEVWLVWPGLVVLGWVVQSAVWAVAWTLE